MRSRSVALSRMYVPAVVSRIEEINFASLIAETPWRAWKSASFLYSEIRRHFHAELKFRGSLCRGEIYNESVTQKDELSSEDTVLPASDRSAGLYGVKAMPSSFFEVVVATSGLSSVIARPAITRACLRAGIDPKNIDPTGLMKALPHLENTLRLYVPNEADARILALRALTK
jgi:hypothetical protein